MRVMGLAAQFRTDRTQLGLQYVLESNATVWETGRQALPAPARKPCRGATPERLQRSADLQPASAKIVGAAIALLGLEGRLVGGTLRSRFGAVRVRPAHRDNKCSEPSPEEWLLIESPKRESEPIEYCLSTLPEETSPKSLVKMAKHRWIIERDYEELKQELGSGHYEGRSWRGFHHHATLCVAAYGFLVAERNRSSPLSALVMLDDQAHSRSQTSARAVAGFAPNGITRTRWQRQE